MQRPTNPDKFKRVPLAEADETVERDLIDSYPVLIRVGEQWYEANAVADVTAGGEPYVRFEAITEPESDPELDTVEAAEALQAVERVVDEELGDEISTSNDKPQVEKAIGSLVASSLSGGEAVLEASGSKLKTVKYEPLETTLIPTVVRSSTGDRVPVLRKADLSELEEEKEKNKEEKDKS